MSRRTRLRTLPQDVQDRVRLWYYVNRVTLGCSRGALDLAGRRLDPAVPATWEFSAFSQNGEDGVLDHLLAMVRRPNRCFLEIGASDGLENNSAYLAHVKKYEGVMVEGSARVVGRNRFAVETLLPAVRYVEAMVLPDTVGEVLAHCRVRDVDVLSLDIDSFDLHVARALLDHGARPKVICVEFNSAFGPEDAVTVPLAPGSVGPDSHPSGLYYGASVAAWRALFESWGYRFVTVESRGVNAFFVDPEAVRAEELDVVQPLPFAENLGQLARHGAGWEAQRALLAGLPLDDVRDAAPVSR
ncbi:MAG TPA: hypothetical protein VD931_22600 [Baekduia sp.]|nr:hypothetical protein [Baekduia sp.]